MRYIINVNEVGLLHTAAVLTTDEWSKMTNKLVEVKQQEELMEKKVRLEQDRKKKSYKMTRNWPSTMASVKRDRERKFADEAKRDAEEKQRQYDEIIKKQREEKAEVIEKARKLVNDSKDTSKTLLSGLIHSKVLDERKRQLQLKQRMWQKNQARKEKEAEDLKRKTEEYKQFLKQEKMDILKKKEKTKLMLSEQFEEHLERHANWLKQKEEEALDLENLRKELEEQSKEEKKNLIESKQEMRREQDRFKQETEKFRTERRMHEKEEDEMNAIYCHVRDKLEKQRKEKELQIRNEMIITREKQAFRTVELPDYTKEEEEQMNAVEEQEEKYQAELKNRQETKAKLRKELLDYQAAKEAAMQQDSQQQLEEKRWELLQRIALDTATKEWNKNEAERIREIKEKVRDDLLKQWQEREENGFRKKADEIEQFNRDCQQDHSDLIQRCEEMIKYAKTENLPLLPINSAISRVKKQVGLREERKDTSFLKSRVPIQSVSLYE